MFEVQHVLSLAQQKKKFKKRYDEFFFQIAIQFGLPTDPMKGCFTQQQHYNRVVAAKAPYKGHQTSCSFAKLNSLLFTIMFLSCNRRNIKRRVD